MEAYGGKTIGSTLIEVLRSAPILRRNTTVILGTGSLKVEAASVHGVGTVTHSVEERLSTLADSLSIKLKTADHVFSKAGRPGCSDNMTVIHRVSQPASTCRDSFHIRIACLERLAVYAAHITILIRYFLTGMELA